MAVIFGLYALGIISEATNVKMVSFGVLVSLHLVLRNEVNTKFTGKVLSEDENHSGRYYVEFYWV